MKLRTVLCIVVFCTAWRLCGQIPVPFVTNAERFMIMGNGRFEEMEPRPPREVHAMEGQVVYRDHEGQLKIFLPEGRRLHVLDRAMGGTVRATRHRLVWNSVDTLKTVREGRAVVLTDHVERFGVSDSLVVYIDSALHQMSVLWKGHVTPLADVLQGSERPQWLQGSNTMAFFNGTDRRLSAFYRGQLRVLCDSTDVGLVAVGGDVVAYWDGGGKRFMVMYKGGTQRLSELRPASVQAGAGIVAYVDGNGRFRCFKDGVVHTVLNTIPSGYWVRDSLLLYLERGQLKLFDPEGAILVEPYVPESWKVEAGDLVYLDINRELRGIRRGQRVRFGTEANIPSFDLFGDAVVYRSPMGDTVVITPRRTYTF